MVRSTRASLLGALLVTATAVPAHAQHVPGAPSIDWDRARNDYTASVLRDYNSVIAEWRETLDNGDVGRALSYYSDGAMILVPGSAAIQGRDSIRAFLQGFAPNVLEIRTGLTDFVASDYLAYATGPLMYTYRTGEAGPIHTVVGNHVTILVREGRRWRIRSQVLKYEEPELQQAARVRQAPASGGDSDPDAWRSQALELIRGADERMRAGDFAGFGSAWSRLKTLLEQT
jgi:uncharacterized protein (TIGR02246 family)